MIDRPTDRPMELMGRVEWLFDGATVIGRRECVSYEDDDLLRGFREVSLVFVFRPGLTYDVSQGSRDAREVVGEHESAALPQPHHAAPPPDQRQALHELRGHQPAQLGNTEGRRKRVKRVGTIKKGHVRVEAGRSVRRELRSNGSESTIGKKESSLPSKSCFPAAYCA